MESEEATYDHWEELISGIRHPLIEACRKGDYEQLTQQIEKFKSEGKPLTVCDHSGWQAIHHAAKLFDTKFLTALLNKDNFLACHNTNEFTSPLIVAVGLGNVDIVTVLLPFLNYDDLFAKDVHGLNSLFYAVSAKSEGGTIIAHMLIEKCKPGDLKPLECFSSYDNLPDQVVKCKNAEILSAMLNAGLNPAYRDDSRKMDTLFDSDDLLYPRSPVTLIGYCLKEGWIEGMKMVVAAQKKIMGQNGISHIWELFTADSTSGTSSALGILCEVGCMEALKLMVEDGFKLELGFTLPRVVHPQLIKNGHTVEAVTYNMLCVLSHALSRSIWDKQDLIKYILSLRSCAEFKQYHVDYMNQLYNETSVADQFAHVIIDEVINNPVRAVVPVILEYQMNKEHSVGESVQMLLDCGFTFDFMVPFCDENQLICHDTITALTLDAYHRRKGFAVIAELVDRSDSIPLTAEGVIGAFHFDLYQSGFDSTYFTVYEWPHLTIVKALSRQSMSELKQIHDSLFVINHDLTFNPNETVHERIADYLNCAQLLLKGVDAHLPNDYHMSSWVDNEYYPNIPFSVWFLTDKEFFHRLSFNDQSDDPLEKKLREENISTLQALSRTVIRKQIGFARLIREPVPRCRDLSKCDVDNSWEISSIDQLVCVPSCLRKFLRFQSEIDEYTRYLDRHEL